jgi:hypothetical protein
MISQPEAAVVTTRSSHARRHCSTICIALVVARFTPAITLANPVSPDEAHAPVSMNAPASAALYLSAHVCASQERCHSIVATISVAPRDSVR